MWHKCSVEQGHWTQSFLGGLQTNWLLLGFSRRTRGGIIYWKAVDYFFAVWNLTTVAITALAKCNRSIQPTSVSHGYLWGCTTDVSRSPPTLSHNDGSCEPYASWLKALQLFGWALHLGSQASNFVHILKNISLLRLQYHHCMQCHTHLTGSHIIVHVLLITLY